MVQFQLSSPEGSNVFDNGEIVSGQITHFSEKDQSFYIVVNEDPIKLPDELMEMFWIPMVDESFLLNSEFDGFFRAVRVILDDESLDPTEILKVYLMDTGESFLIKIRDIQENCLYEMPEETKKIPGRAIKCSLQQLKITHPFDSDFDFISSNLYRKFNFEVTETSGSSLMVNVMAFHVTDLDSFSDEDTDEASGKENGYKMSEASHGFTLDMMTAQDREILNEQPLNTGNPLLATQGFVTRDDDRLCKFYDPAIGGCFKGGRCKQRHQLEIQDGTCRDKEKICFNNIPKILPNPQLHSTVRIEITHFYSLSKFVCRYRKLKPSRREIDLESLIRSMNEAEQVRKFRPIRFLPAFKQLVLYQSPDGNFYRARVEELYSEYEKIKLLLVDLGIIVTASQSNIYDWCNEFNFMTFQAVEMEIANIKTLPGSDGEEGIKVIIEHMKNWKNSLKAVVFGNIDGIQVKLLNKDDEDIGQELVDRKLALAKAVDPPFMGFVIPARP